MRGVAFGLVTAMAACGGSAEDAATGSGYVKAHDIRELMEVVVTPQADVFWSSAGTIIDAAGERDLAPTTDEGWLTTRSAAATVAEMGNLLLTPQYSEGRGEDWLQFSRSLVEIGMRAEKAAADRDIDGMLDVGGTMYNVCNACHLVYLPTSN